MSLVGIRLFCNSFNIILAQNDSAESGKTPQDSNSEKLFAPGGVEWQGRATDIRSNGSRYNRQQFAPRLPESPLRLGERMEPCVFGWGLRLGRS